MSLRLSSNAIKQYNVDHKPYPCIGRITLSKDKAQDFYFIHKEKPFFNDLIEYMTSEPVIVQVLEAENAVLKYREVMGSTNPKDAISGSIRNLYGLNIQENSVHGSDSNENAQKEIKYFFDDLELVG